MNQNVSELTNKQLLEKLKKSKPNIENKKIEEKDKDLSSLSNEKLLALISKKEETDDISKISDISDAELKDQLTKLETNDMEEKDKEDDFTKKMVKTAAAWGAGQTEAMADLGVDAFNTLSALTPFKGHFDYPAISDMVGESLGYDKGQLQKAHPTAYGIGKVMGNVLPYLAAPAVDLGAGLGMASKFIPGLAGAVAKRPMLSGLAGIGKDVATGAATGALYGGLASGGQNIGQSAKYGAEAGALLNPVLGGAARSLGKAFTPGRDLNKMRTIYSKTGEKLPISLGEFADIPWLKTLYNKTLSKIPGSGVKEKTEIIQKAKKDFAQSIADDIQKNTDDVMLESVSKKSSKQTKNKKKQSNLGNVLAKKIKSAYRKERNGIQKLYKTIEDKGAEFDVKGIIDNTLETAEKGLKKMGIEIKYNDIIQKGEKQTVKDKKVIQRRRKQKTMNRIIVPRGGKKIVINLEDSNAASKVIKAFKYNRTLPVNEDVIKDYIGILRNKEIPMDFKDVQTNKTTYGKKSRDLILKDSKNDYMALAKASDDDRLSLLEKSGVPDLAQSLKHADRLWRNRIVPYKKNSFIKKNILHQQKTSELEKNFVDKLGKDEYHQFLKGLTQKEKETIGHKLLSKAKDYTSLDKPLKSPQALLKAYTDLSERQQTNLFSKSTQEDFTKLKALQEVSKEKDVQGLGLIGKASLTGTGVGIGGLAHFGLINPSVIGAGAIAAGTTMATGKALSKLLTSKFAKQFYTKEKVSAKDLSRWNALTDFLKKTPTTQTAIYGQIGKLNKEENQ